MRCGYPYPYLFLFPQRHSREALDDILTVRAWNLGERDQEFDGDFSLLDNSSKLGRVPRVPLGSTTACKLMLYLPTHWFSVR
jgi:hypothetical protein